MSIDILFSCFLTMLKHVMVSHPNSKLPSAITFFVLIEKAINRISCDFADKIKVLCVRGLGVWMKFGKYLEENLNQEWKFHYIDYEGLKDLIKGRGREGGDNEFSEKDEAKFVDALEKEMEKVFDFRDVKGGELTRHVQHCENVVATTNSPKDLMTIEEEIGRITNELSLLATFTRLNYTSFIKILKKHDKRTDFMLKPTFMLRLNSKPLYLENLDSLIYRLSKLYDKIRQKISGEEEFKQTNLVSTSAETFVRKTSKYWVHSENVTSVKCAVLKYLPVLIFPTKRRKIDLAVSSIYLDNDEMELYKGRLEKIEGGMAIRIRWYGSDDPNEVFIERKIHREDWTGEVSVKTRFLLKSKHVYDYMTGKFSPEDLMEKLSKDPKQKPEDIQAVGQLAKEIQETIIQKGLKPKIRTFYNRTAFQLPADARVRISLDTDLAMIREDGPKRSGDSWKRNDIGTVDFEDLSSKEIYRFPHSILEVKLQTQAGQEPPQWVQSLINGDLVEEVPKFSKFIHGCASLFINCTVLPYWFDQMNIDIRKFPSVRESQSDSDMEASGKPDVVIDIGEKPDLTTDITPLLAANQERTLRESGAAGIQRSIPSPGANPRLNLEEGKRIFVPVRVEPKVFFANERTFLSWIHFSIFLGGIATALVGFGNRSAKFSGYLFAFVSILFTLYALYLYQWRAARIRNRDPGPYDDRIGPTAVVIIFVLAMITNIIFAASTTGF